MRERVGVEPSLPGPEKSTSWPSCEPILIGDSLTSASLASGVRPTSPRQRSRFIFIAPKLVERRVMMTVAGFSPPVESVATRIGRGVCSVVQPGGRVYFSPPAADSVATALEAVTLACGRSSGVGVDGGAADAEASLTGGWPPGSFGSAAEAFVGPADANSGSPAGLIYFADFTNE